MMLILHRVNQTMATLATGRMVNLTKTELVIIEEDKVLDRQSCNEEEHVRDQYLAHTVNHY